MTEKHQLLTDQELETQFKNSTLAPVLFTHEAHLRLAYIQLNAYSFDNACIHLCTQIENFDKLYGKGTKFNKDITIASLRVMEEFMAKATKPGFRNLICEFPQLNTHFFELIQDKMSEDPVKSLSQKGLSHSVLYS